VELGRGNDGERDGTRLHDGLLRPLARIVRVALDLVQPRDAQRHVVPYARSLLGLQQVAGGRREEVHRVGPIGRGAVHGVDHRFHAGQRRRQSRTGPDVHSLFAADPPNVMPISLEGRHRQRTDPAGGSNHGNAHGSSFLLGWDVSS
jgi:hypothetical protein